jgi:N-acetylmuramic acid 6-phosphate etherase
MIEDSKLPITEQRYEGSKDIDVLSTIEMVRVMNNADGEIHLAVRDVLPQIAKAIDEISKRMRQGGRLIYMGAGTSGRLGVLDASECPPTFNIEPGRVVGLIAGGDRALRQSVEQVEDDQNAGEMDLSALNLGALDSVVGLAASGRTPYVVGGLTYAQKLGALTVCIVCVHESVMFEFSDITINPVVGAEVITGSTRLKAGTAQKMVLNMISTGTMVQLGKTYGNLMVDLQATNAKLRERATRIVQQACGISASQAARALRACNGEVKTAIVMLIGDHGPEEARRKLSISSGVVQTALMNDL